MLAFTKLATHQTHDLPPPLQNSLLPVLGLAPSLSLDSPSCQRKKLGETPSEE